MTNALAETIKTLATATATRLCGEALASLAVGRKAFVKGKPVMVPFSDDARAQRKQLQLSAFVPGMQVDAILAGAVGALSTEAEADEAVALYCATGRAVVESIWSAS